MPLRLRPSHLQYPDASWPPTDGRSPLYGEIPVGSLNRIEHGPTKDLWEWSITVNSTGHGLTMQGTEGGKEFAVSAFTSTFRRWFDWAGLKDGDPIDAHLSPWHRPRNGSPALTGVTRSSRPPALYR